MTTNRALLHENKLGAFHEWAVQLGYITLPLSRSEHEVLRLRAPDPSGDGHPLVFYQRQRSCYITCYGDGLNLVNRWMKVRKPTRRVKP